jgi:DNA modification methylase
VTNTKTLLQGLPEAYYSTEDGAAFLGDGLELIANLPDDSVDLIMTSPPFALVRKKQYGNVDAEKYVEWFRPFSEQFWRVLKPEGSLVLHIGGSWDKGQPTRSLYHLHLLLDLCKKFHLAQEFFWYNPSRLPSPAEWVTVRRIRVKDAVDYVWWLSKNQQPKADNRKVLKSYSSAMLDLLKNGYKAKLRPSGHDISANFQNDRGGSIPPNILIIANTESNSYYLRACRASDLKPHPARYPSKLPEFFIEFLTDAGDVVLDPFSGSNVTGEVAEKLNRKWLAFEIVEEYIKGSRFRFEAGHKRLMAEGRESYA